MLKQVLTAATLGAGVLFAGAALAQTQAPMAQLPATQTMHKSHVWYPNTPAKRRGLRIGNVYTEALNTLYAQGFHGVHGLSYSNGMVMATVTTPKGTARQVTVNPATHQVANG